MSKPRHPVQPLFEDEGTLRFKANSIVRFLYDTSQNKMNELIVMPFPKEDFEQFAQLIGYSLNGAMELPYVTDRVIEKAQNKYLKRAKRSRKK